MAKSNSQMFCRTILLLSFVAFAISLKTATKRDKNVLGGEVTSGRSSAEWLEPVGDKASKKMVGGAQPGYVYLITTTNAPPGQEQVKIGRSIDPNARRTQLQVGNAWTLEVSNMYPVDDMVAAEAAAKQAMRTYLIRGEWYHFPPGGITSVRRIVSRAIGPYKIRDDVPRKNV